MAERETLSGVTAGLEEAGRALMQAASLTGANVEKITIRQAASLLAMASNADLLSAAVEAGTCVNQALNDVYRAENQPVAAPCFHS